MTAFQPAAEADSTAHLDPETGEGATSANRNGVAPPLPDRAEAPIPEPRPVLPECRIQDLTLAEKTRLLAGDDFWHSGSLAGKTVPLRLSDGPHGLRLQTLEAAAADMAESYPATCFPTASALACSFDEDLLERVGAALGDECRDYGVDLLLGPGVNLKRDPRGGRNFEYFSEDPVLSGTLGAAYIRGVQSEGAGACCKHMAANNQERKRMVSDSIVDARTLHEQYLLPFEIAVREGRPWALMLAYNRLNGTYCTESADLLQLAREEWGFDGIFVSDWGSMSDSAASVAAGLSLCMPGPRPDHIIKVREALADGSLSEAAVDDAVAPLLDLNRRVDAARREHPAPRTSAEREQAAAEREDLAERAARETAVLLENDGILPLDASCRLAIIGAYAAEPLIEGGGSSRVTPRSTLTPLAALRDRFCPGAAYAPGYDPATGCSTDDLAREACRAAREADTVVVFLGQPEGSESEGYDRDTLSLPDSQMQLLQAIAAANPNVAAVLQCGGPVEVSWRDSVRALLLSSFSGCRGGGAIADLLFGAANPSGKLAETWPLSPDDTPCGASFPDAADRVFYREGPYFGYRYYDAAGLEPAYPFGFGRSYTQFAYDNLQLSCENAAAKVRFDLTCAGPRAGAEAVQLYVAPRNPGAFRPVQELRAFRKIALEPGETAIVAFDLDERAFRRYDADEERWVVESGAYEVRIGASSRDIRLRQTIEIAGEPPRADDPALEPYRNVRPGGFTDEAFAALLGHPLPAPMRPRTPLTIDSPVGDLDASHLGRFGLGIIERIANGFVGGGGAMARRMLQEVPLRSAPMAGIDMSRIEALVRMLNHEGGVRAALARNYAKRLEEDGE